MPQLSPSHPSHREYSAKRPLGHQPFRQPSLSEIFDSYFCCLLISPPPSPTPSLFTAYFTSFVWELAPVPETAFYCTSPFPSSAEKRGGGGGGKVCKDEAACAPPAPPDIPPIFPFQPRSNYRGFGGISHALFHMVQIPTAIKNIFLRKRKRKAEKARGSLPEQHCALGLRGGKSPAKALILRAHKPAKPESLLRQRNPFP